jgi:hypothetical protein
MRLLRLELHATLASWRNQVPSLFSMHPQRITLRQIVFSVLTQKKRNAADGDVCDAARYNDVGHPDGDKPVLERSSPGSVTSAEKRRAAYQAEPPEKGDHQPGTRRVTSKCALLVGSLYF